MLLHYLKIAFRNLWKYKTQNIISIIGLAIGFICFAFSALWLRYEMSYDNFHSKSDRIFRVHIAPFKWDPGAANTMEVANCPYPLVEFLKINFPEIEEAGGMLRSAYMVDQLFIPTLAIDKGISTIFDLGLEQDFFLEGRPNRPMAVIPELYNDEIKESLLEKRKVDVIATIPQWHPNTNLKFKGVSPIHYFLSQAMKEWNRMYQTATSAVPLLNRNIETYILIHKNVDVRAFKEKLDKVAVPEVNSPLSVVLTPITQLRYKDPTGSMQEQSAVKFTHIRIFTIAGLMVILCSLFNHLTLFVSRIRMRLRELALRKVNGASNWQLTVTLFTDFLLVILLALIFGFLSTVLLLPIFKGYATIEADNVKIYTELAFYTVLLLGCGFIAGLIPSVFFQHQNLNTYIKGGSAASSRNTFRKVSLVVQLIISLVMIFCSVVFVKQIRFLHNVGLGLNYKNIAHVTTAPYPMLPEYPERIKQIPGVVDAIPANYGTFSPMHNGSFPHSYVDSLGNTVEFNLFILMCDNRFFDFFGVKIIEGRVFENDGTTGQYLLNETAIKEVGKFDGHGEELIGVFRDFHFFPTQRAKATKAHYHWGELTPYAFPLTVYKYEPGMREQTERAIKDWLLGSLENLNETMIRFTYLEEVFERNFKSENELLKLISIMTLACILIAIFGVYSLTSLTCQQRRKDIAIRKVHGAEVVDIMNIFFKEYLILLGIAALVAFPAGYIIMKRWMEGYVKQTSMDAWLYVAIFLIVFVVIVFSIVSIVWKAANQNPARVVVND